MKKLPDDRSPKVLITGGSGFIGRYLTSLLLSEGYIVCHLSRKQNSFGKVRVYRWDPENRIADDHIFADIDYIIHLAGENLSGKRWTKRQKEVILKSRTDSAKLLHEKTAGNRSRLKAFISASAVGYYGSVTSEKTFSENDPPADDFLGTVCRAWEESARLFSESGIRSVRIRTGVVLEKSHGALASVLSPARYGIFSYPGNGLHYLPWIHISDLCGIYLRALKDYNMTGAYNAVSPHYVNYREFMKSLAGVMGKPFLHPPLPGLLLRIFLGGMSQMLLTGSRVSPEKIIKAGYIFKYDNLRKALNEL